MRHVPQIRQYTSDDVPDAVIDGLLDLARWTGSSQNLQPWHFIVVRDKDTLRTIGALRPNIGWLAEAPVGIAIVLDSAGTSATYDEGRVTERILTGAKLLGYGGGVAWFGDASQQAEAKRALGVPAEKAARQIVMIGKPLSAKDPRPMARAGGRKPLSELVHYERWGRQRT